MSSPEKRNSRAGRLLWIASLLFSALLILAACGPERSKSGTAKLTDEAVRIAQQYEQNGDLNQARAALNELEVANPLQWLVYLAETAITSNVDADETQALVRLAIALGSQSQTILSYAVQMGLVEAKATPTAQAAANDTPVIAAEVVQPPPLPTVAVVALEPTATPESSPTATPAAVLLEPTATAASVTGPQVVASSAVNVRGGPGTAYPIVSAMQTGQTADIVGKNPQADWWQVAIGAGQVGWVLGQLVTTAGDTGSVAVAANIPEPPPTATPAPVAVAPVAEAPPPEPAAEQPPAEQPPAPAEDGPDFVVVEKRLWNVYENGGSLSGPTVICGEKHELIVNVLDANGGRLNNVVVQSDFNAAEAFVTGAQGKGDGVAEFVLWSGQDVKIVRDADGREVTSEVARGMTTRTPDIPFEYLIAGQFCTDEASCNKFAKPPDQAPGCWGHFSWTVTFQRKY